MSVSSCPRCAQQVTLPVGVSNNARVRCPLCNAQYVLADALVNMPPLLEVLDDGQEDSPLEWMDEPAAARSPAVAEASAALDPDADDELAFATEVDASRENSAPEEDGLRFDAVEFETDEKLETHATETKPAEHDDLLSQEQDTEVEELSFDAPEASLAASPQVEELSFDEFSSGEAPATAAASDEELLDFGDESPQFAAEAASELSDLGDLDSMPDEEQVAFEADEQVAFEFEAEALAKPTDANDLGIDFEEFSPSEAVTGATIDFGQPVRDVPADDEPVELEFAEEPATTLAETIEFTEAPAKGKKKGKKEKPPKPAKVKAARPPGQRSLTRTLLAVVLPGLIAVPLALYGALWLSPAYDVVGLAKWLPSAALPASFKKPKPSTTLAMAPPAAPVLPAAEPEAPAVEPSAEAAAPEGSTAEPAPSSEAPAEPAAETDPPATEPPAPAATEPSTPPAEPAPVAEAEAPAATAPASDDQPAEDPFAPAATPSEPPRDEPPAVESPSSEPVPAADTPDPFAEPPAKGAPEEMPGDAKSAEEMPAEEATPADDSAPSPFDESDATPAAEPAPVEEPVGPRNAKPVAPEDVTKAAGDFLAADKRLVAAMAGADKNEVKKARAGFFLSLYHFADMFAAVNRAPFEAQPADFQQGMQQMAGDAARLKELRSYAARWLAFGKRTTPGIVLAGTVERVEQVGKLFLVGVKLTDEAPGVEVVSPVDPRVEAGDEVIVMGTIVETPSEQLAGYDGAEPVAIWSGVTFRVPAGEK